MKQILDGLILHEVELDLQEVAMAEPTELSLQDDGVRLPAKLVIDLHVSSLDSNLLMLHALVNRQA